MDVGELFKFIVLASALAVYVLLLLLLFGRILNALVSYLRAAGRSVEGPERVTDFGRRASIYAFSVTRRRPVR
jgi:hypothetical protein